MADVPLTGNDRIIILDAHVAAELHLPRDLTSMVWDIPDPFGGSIEDYRRCASILRDRIEELAHDG